MTEDTLTSGFRSLVQQIQQNDVEAGERERPQRRRLSLRRDTRPNASAEPAAAAPMQATAAPLRLLTRRWL